MLYDNEARRLLAREHVERLSDDMRRGRRLTPTEAGYPSGARVARLLGRAVRLGRFKEPRIPAYDA